MKLHFQAVPWVWGSLLGRWKCSGTRYRGWLHDTVKELNATEAFALKWLISCCANCTEIFCKVIFWRLSTPPPPQEACPVCLPRFGVHLHHTSQPRCPEAHAPQEPVCGRHSPTGQCWPWALCRPPKEEPTQVTINSRTSESINDGRFLEWKIPQQRKTTSY